MDVESLVLERNGFKDFNPVQRKAIDVGVIEGKSIVVSSPTASGKTIIAELAMISSIMKGGKAIYTAPLKALAHEHYSSFKKKYPEFKTALSIGDYDSSDPHLSSYDAIFTTFEKLDSLLRHKPPWLKNVSTLVVDEVHVLDSDRGPTLEILLTKIKKIGVQIVALSATIPNAHEIADWLNAELVISDWRPVKLKEGVFYENKLLFPDEEKEYSSLDAVIEEVLSQGKGVLIFAPTRKSAMSRAKKLRSLTSKYISSRASLRLLSERVLSALESPTIQCKELAEDIIHGVAFHHAGLVQKQREIVEEGFRQGLIKVVVATPTLAAGVNLPAFRVIILSLKREGPFRYEIPVREYKQMAGRAGRPKYDTHGEAIIVCKSEEEARHYLKKYVLGEPEEVLSRLSGIRAIRFHTLSLICEGYRSFNDLLDFFLDTFFFYQQRDLSQLELLLEEAVSDLESWSMIKNFTPTPLGKRTTSLYIDPETAHLFDVFSRHPKVGEFPILFLIASSIELSPYLPVSRKEEISLLADAEERSEELPFPMEDLLSDIHFLNKYKFALMLEAWVNEVDEDQILNDFNVSPGILRGFLSIAEWMAYSLSEISKLNNSPLTLPAKMMEIRIRYGVREELLPLVTIKGIGRKRARKLFDAGFKTPVSLKKADPRQLARLLGPKVASSVLSQLGVKADPHTLVVDQTTLEVFTDGAT